MGPVSPLVRCCLLLRLKEAHHRVDLFGQCSLDDSTSAVKDGALPLAKSVDDMII